jgi:hypothetical protein
LLLNKTGILLCSCDGWLFFLININFFWGCLLCIFLQANRAKIDTVQMLQKKYKGVGLSLQAAPLWRMRAFRSIPQPARLAHSILNFLGC